MNGLPELKTYGSKDILQTLATGYQLRNLRAQEGLADLDMAEKQKQAQRAASEEKRKAGKHKAAHQLSAVKYAGRLLHNVSDEASYKDALFRFSQAYPDYATTIPTEYDPATVKRMVGWGLAYEKMSDQKSTVGKLLAERDALPADDSNRIVLDQKIAKEITREGFTVKPDGKGGFEITEEEKDYQPKLFVHKETSAYKWIKPGDDVPSDYITLEERRRIKGEVKPKEALQRISAIREKMANFDKSSIVTQGLAIQFPDLAPYIGQDVPKELKDKVFEAWNDELEYLQQFVPKKEDTLSDLSDVSDEELINMLVPQEE